MINSGIIKTLKIAFAVAVIILIFVNPLTYGKGDMSRIKMFSDGINEIFKALGGKSGIDSGKMLDIILFTEYSLLGISMAIATKAIYGDIIRNISSPLFIGLISAVIMAYRGDNSFGLVSGTAKIMIMFYGLVFGLGIYLLLGFISSGFKVKSSSGNRYRRRR